MADSAYRQILMLRKIPRLPQTVSTGRIHEYLQHQEGFDISLRSVQRDLNSLSTVFPLVSTQQGRETHWSFLEKGVVDIPALDIDTAIAFDMVERFLKDLLPPSALANLYPHIEAAQHKLEEARQHKRIGKWSDKVRVLSRGQPLIKAEIPPDVLSGVYQALYEERSLVISREGKRDAEISPLGIVHRGATIYLVCRFWGYDQARQVALHRITRAEVLDKPATPMPGFCLDDYIQKEHQFHYPIGDKPLQLKARFFDWSGSHLLEIPLSEDQQAVEEDESTLLITATVDDTMELRWWLLAFGGNVEVLGDETLLAWMREQSGWMAEYYWQEDEQDEQ